MRVHELIDILSDQPADAEVELAVIAPVEEGSDDITVDRYFVDGVLPWEDDENDEDSDGELTIWLVGGQPQRDGPQTDRGDLAAHRGVFRIAGRWPAVNDGIGDATAEDVHGGGVVKGRRRRIVDVSLTAACRRKIVHFESSLATARTSQRGALVPRCRCARTYNSSKAVTVRSQA